MSEILDYSSFENRYKDKEYIGAGGFGKVYKVFDHAKNHYVALKVSDVRPEWTKFTLKNEVELVNRMDVHRNIARYDACYRYNTGITGEMDFAILKFYEDGNLEQFLKREKISFEDKRLIIQGIIEGIQFLHRNNVIHRDLKSQNILMSREDGVWCPKITDFGLSREVSENSVVTNSAVGISYAYAAPEQILNQKIYKNVDLWSTGVIIYRILLDELPFLGRKEGSQNSAQSQLELSNKIVNLELPAKLEEMEEPFKSIVKRCLVLDPLERVQSPDELLDILYGNKKVFENIQKPIDSQNLPEIDESDSKTELILTPSNTHQNEYSVPTDHGSVSVAQDEQANYEVPKENVTQFIGTASQARDPQPSSDDNKEPAFEVNMGGDKGGFNYRHLIIIVAVLTAVIAGGVIGYQYWGGSTIDEPAATEETIVKPEQEVVEEVPVKAEKADKFDISLAEAQDASTLTSLRNELNEKIENTSGIPSYDLYYYRVRLEYFNDYLIDEKVDYKEIAGFLNEAYKIAMKAPVTQKAMLSKMRQDETGDLASLLDSGRMKKIWEEVKTKLEN